MAARVATVAVIRMYLRVMNDGWVRGVGFDESDTDMDGKEVPFFFCPFGPLLATPMMMVMILILTIATPSV